MDTCTSYTRSLALYMSHEFSSLFPTILIGSIKLSRYKVYKLIASVQSYDHYKNLTPQNLYNTSKLHDIICE